MKLQSFPQADWAQIASGAEHDGDETHSFSGMCAFSMGIMGEEAEGTRFDRFFSSIRCSGNYLSSEAGVH